MKRFAILAMMASALLMFSGCPPGEWVDTIFSTADHTVLVNTKTAELKIATNPYPESKAKDCRTGPELMFAPFDPCKINDKLPACPGYVPPRNAVERSGDYFPTQAYIRITLEDPKDLNPKRDIKLAARRASVQTNFYIPILKISFTEPLEEKESLTEADIQKILKEKIEEALEAEREEAKIDKYEHAMTAINEAYLPGKLRTEIPLGALAPDHAKFPVNILAVTRTEAKEVKPWDDESDDDVLLVSENANVSISQARMILQQLHAVGYSITREEASPDSEIELFYFREWTDTATKLDWEVRVEGSDQNIIVGYDPRGILLIRSVPEGKQVFVRAGYFDLKLRYKPKDGRIEALEEELSELKKSSLEKEKVEKRDISKATMYDVQMGRVELSQFWAQTSASGVFLGNMKVRKEADGYQFRGRAKHNVVGEYKGIVLTNAHVADMAMQFTIHLSENKEKMWIIYPADSYIRYTRDSDLYGSPAQVLAMDDRPVLSWDFDCALMATTKVTSLQEHKALLGDSDNVKEGDPIVSVGNPALMQKFMTTGIVSNLNYSIMQSQYAGMFFKDLNRGTYTWALNSNFWYEATIGVGGTSGSGVWAMSGPEAGKVVALHNMGMTSVRSFSSASDAGVKIDGENLNFPNGLLKDVLRDHGKELFASYDYKDAKFCLKIDDMEKAGLPERACRGVKVDIAGMNGAVPINKIKAFLQERGIDPSVFDFSSLGGEHWTQ